MTEDSKKKVGRPSKFDEALTEKIIGLAKEGKTDAEIAELIGVTERTFYLWKRSKPEFFQALKEGKSVADDLVVTALFRRAVGYSHKESKVVSTEGGAEVVEVIKHYPPDPVSAIYWLNNRQPEQWRNAHRLEHTGKNGGPIESVSLTLEEFKKAMADLVGGISGDDKFE